MKEFSSTDLRTSSNSVYNEVMLKGEAKITHRDRPNMVLIDEDKLERLLNFAADKGYRIATAESFK